MGWEGRGESHNLLLHGLHSLLLPSGDPLPAQPSSIPLPSPHITFQLWTDEEQLCKSPPLWQLARNSGICVCLCASVYVCCVSVYVFVLVCVSLVSVCVLCDWIFVSIMCVNVCVCICL